MTVDPTARVGIIGGGWYGCHVASVLREQGFDVIIYERNSQLFSEGSRWNQFRLHQGFHYARSWNTRIETIRGFHQVCFSLVL
jgi:glycine/D-amino acid oxidase-like deaminating enzyme